MMLYGVLNKRCTMFTVITHRATTTALQDLLSGSIESDTSTIGRLPLDLCLNQPAVG